MPTKYILVQLYHLSKMFQARTVIPVSDYKHPGVQLTAHAKQWFVFLE